MGEIAQEETPWAGQSISDVLLRRPIKPLSPVLPKSSAQERIRAEGLEGRLTIGDAGVRSSVLDILIERKREELKRNTIRQQSPGGAGRFAANLMVGFAGQLVDPVNVASAFVPVVAPGRYAAMLARASGPMGRAGVRGAVGALEGTVGAAIVEPFNYAANRQQQADWEAMDSALNIAGGLFFGGALHAGAGLFGDMIRPARPSRAVTEQVQEPAKPPTFDPRELSLQRERTIVLDRLAEGRPLTRQEALTAASAKFDGAIEAKTKGGVFRIIDEEVETGGMMPEGSWIREAVAYDKNGNEVGRLQYANDGTPPTVEVAEGNRRQGIATAMLKVAKERGGQMGDAQTGMGDGLPTYRTEEGQAFRSSADESTVELRFADEKIQAQVEAEADRMLGDGQNKLSKSITDAIRNDRFRQIRPFLAKLPQETQEGMFRMALVQAITGRPIDVSPGLYAHYGDLKSATDAAMRNADEVAGADHVASQVADARIKDAPKDDLAALKEQAAEEEAMLKQQAEASGIEIELDEGVMAAAKAKTKAVEIAALCMLRAG
jgi:GNAT superfamily N-acetyltransferase